MARKQQPDPQEPSCPQCRHFRRIPDTEEGFGTCRRYPPQVIADDDGDPASVFPLVNANACCGEFTGGM